MLYAQGPVRVALIGSGRMGAFHGETLARRLPGAVLAAVADPAPGAVERLATTLSAPMFFTDAAEAFADRRSTPSSSPRRRVFTPTWRWPQRPRARECSARSRWR